MEIEKLQKLGLTEKEAIIYVNALSLGTFSVSSIAHKTGIKRPTCYIVLDELAKKNLVTRVPRAKKAFFTAENPELLLKQANEKVSIIENTLPYLKSLISTDKKEPLIKYYTGQNGVRKIFDEILKCKSKKYLFIGSGKDVIEITGKVYIDGWLEKRNKKQIEGKSIRMKKTEVDDDLYQKQPHVELRLAPENIHISDTIFVYDDKVAVLSAAQENFGFVVNSNNFSQTMNALFSALWSISEKQH